MLSTSGLLPQAVDVANATRAATAPAPVATNSSGWLNWVIGALALGVLGWLASQFLGHKPAPVVTEVPAATKTVTTETTTAPAETTTVPAATATVNPLLVDGVDIGEKFQGIVNKLTGTLAGVKDAASATASLPALTDADTALGGLSSVVGALTGDGKSAFQTMLGAALPALKSTITGLVGDSAIGPIVKPALDGILGKLVKFGG
jgi:hypothetical protein